MTSKQEKRAFAIIEQQLSMAVVTLEEMHKAGLTDDREIQLDFFFDAPNDASAKALAAHLEGLECLSLDTHRAPGSLAGKYVVCGKTHPTAVTWEVLKEWIPWIVVQGICHNCEFDGWGAAVPTKESRQQPRPSGPPAR
jgi:hypothetical protein